MKIRPRRWLRIGLVLLVAALVLPPPAAQAQIGGSIGYGSSVYGTLAAGQSLTFSFPGTAEDLVQATIRNWTGTLDPQLTLVAPDGQTVASSTTNPFSEDPLSATLSLYLPQTGIYSLLASGENATAGDFVLKLYGRGPVVATPLVFGTSVDVAVPPGAAEQLFGFDAQDCPTVFTVANLSEGEPFTFPFVVKVRDEQGVEIAQLYGGDALEDRLILAPNSGHYEVAVSANDPLAQGSVRLNVSCGDQAPGCIPGSLSGGAAGGAGLCPSCFGDDFGGEMCAVFQVTATLDNETATFTWPPVEGADHYIFSIVDASGALLVDSAVMITDATSHTYVFDPGDLLRGPFTAIVTAGSEIDGLLCSDSVPIGSESHTEACSGISVGADIVPGERVAVVSWGGVPGAAAYLLHVYAVGDDGGLIGIRVLAVSGDHTSYHLDGVFPSEYSRFRVEVAAYSEGSGGGAFGDMPQGYLCSGSTDFEFPKDGPVQWGPAA